jgi:hypothetical protein
MRLIDEEESKRCGLSNHQKVVNCTDDERFYQ